MMYQEKQRFTQWWLWAILIGVSALAIFGIYRQIILGQPFGDNPMSDSGLIIFAVLMIALSAFFWSIHLDTRIDKTHVRFSFFPFLKKSVERKNINSAKVLDYGTVGGWGIKQSRKYGTVYSTGGDLGLAIVMQNGDKFVIGTQNESELETFLRKENLSELDSTG